MKLEKFEIEENFKEKLNQLKISMEKNKINQNFGDICIKSEDFGSHIQRIAPKNHSTDIKESLNTEQSEPEKLTFRKCV